MKFRILKGLGFREELNDGSFALISNNDQYARDNFFIKPEFCEQGIGSWALQEASLCMCHSIHAIYLLTDSPCRTLNFGLWNLG